MAGSFQVHNGRGEEIGNFLLGHLDRSYQIRPGLRIPLYDMPAWCIACSAFVAAERLLSLDEIEAGRQRALSRADDAELAKEMPSLSELIAQNAAKHQKEKLEEWSQMREWRLKRLSPRKCLECGSTLVLRVRDGEDAYHPITGESITVRAWAHLSMRTHFLYTPEGDAIRSAAT